MPDSGVVCHVLPAADAYCTVHPSTTIGELLWLNSSTKSFLYVAPEFPPPPYTWLITIAGDAASASRPLAVATSSAITTGCTSLSFSQLLISASAPSRT